MRTACKGARPIGAAVLLASALVLGGCQTFQAVDGPKMGADGGSDAVEGRTTIRALAAKGLEALREREYENASRLLNAALKLDVTNPDLQFLNGLVYHLQGVDGDSTKFELAEQGFTRALKFDPGHAASRYQLGLLYMDQRRYALARDLFAAAARNSWDDPDILYNLAVSAYYARDPRTARAALKRLRTVAPDWDVRPDYLKAAAIGAAALDDRAESRAHLAALERTPGGSDLAAEVEARVAAWAGFYEHDAPFLLAQSNPYAPGLGADDPYAQDPYGGDPYATDGAPPVAPSSDGFADPGTGAGFTDPTAQPSAFAEDQMVVVDVVLIGTQEDVRNSRGVNLLNGLQLQFGDPLTGTAGLSWSESITDDRYNSGLETATRTITRSISIPAVTYSLNIANALNANNEILAKPSLVAQSGETSEFFSGTEILAAAVSGGQGDSVSVQKEVGVKLAVTPEVLPDDMLRLHVVAERTFLTDPANSVVFEFRLDTTKTNVNSTVTMRYGETLVLGGLSERETSRSLDGVPILRDIPGLDMFFSERAERRFERSILILLTPRRPHYTARSEAVRAQERDQLSQFEDELDRLRNRHEDWFTLEPTTEQILERLRGRPFFEEFQTGDMPVQSWNDRLDDLPHIGQVERRLTAG